MNEMKNKNMKKKLFWIGLALALICLIICFIVAYSNVKNGNTSSAGKNTLVNSSFLSSKSDSKNISITEGGSYDLSGEYESIIVNTNEEVTLNLNDVTIENLSGPAINVEKAKTVTIVLSGTNKITAETTEDLDGAIYSKADLVFEGTGSIEVNSNYDGIVSKDTLVIKNGTYTINSDDDGIRGKDCVEISDGTFTINAGGDGIKSSNDEDTTLGYVTITGGSYNITAKSDGIQGITKATISGGTFNITAAEGIEGTYVKIDDGTINISASDDGINASQKSNIGTPKVEINGGDITIKMGQGDTDGIDSNGNIYINGGTVYITGNSPFDYDGEGVLNGGTVIVNGTEVDSLSNQSFGGMKGGMMPGNMNQNGERPQFDKMPEDMNQDGNFPQMDQMPEEMKQNGERPQGGKMPRQMDQNGNRPQMSGSQNQE